MDAKENQNIVQVYDVIQEGKEALLVRTILMLILALGADARADVTIAEKGLSLYRIVIATNAIPSERYAAEELQRYLERAGGAKRPIVTDAEKWIGPNRWARNSDVARGVDAEAMIE